MFKESLFESPHLGLVLFLSLLQSAVQQAAKHKENRDVIDSTVVTGSGSVDTVPGSIPAFQPYRRRKELEDLVK